MTQPLNPNESSRCEVSCEIDARGLACPLPLLRAKQGLKRVQAGQCVRVLATDAGSVRDFHAFAELSGHHLLQFTEHQGEYEYLLQKAGEKVT